MTGFRLSMPGKVYHAFASSDVSMVPLEEDWPEPNMYKHGPSGYVFVYDDLSAEQVEQILSHVQNVALGFAEYGPDPDTRAEGRAGLRWVRRENARQ